jgi:hypothetical protein
MWIMTSKPGGAQMANTPSSSEVTELALEASPEAVRRLVTLMRSRDEQVAIAACSAILDRAFGKPVQHVAVKLIVERKAMQDDLQQLSDAELSDLVARKVAAIEDLLAKPAADPKKAH